MVLIMAGPPGSGKGTQTELLSKKLGIPAIVMGDILRRAVIQGNEVGREAKSFMDKGLLVPDRVVVKLIEQRLSQDDCIRGFILDGFPRNRSQAEALDTILSNKGIENYFFLFLNIGKEEIIKRLSKRRLCRDCGKPYHLLFNPPAVEGKCDVCGGELYQRDDDREDTILDRLDVYNRETAPMVDLYTSRGKVIEIDASSSITSTFERIMEMIKGAREKA